MDWIKKYRLFGISDHLGNINTGYSHEESNIFKLIRNHHLNSFINNRDYKISYIMDDTIDDPLEYLNPYLNHIYGRFNVLDLLMSYGGGGRLITSSTYIIDDFYDWFDDNYKKSNIYLYQIIEGPGKKISIIGSTLGK